MWKHAQLSPDFMQAYANSNLLGTSDGGQHLSQQAGFRGRTVAILDLDLDPFERLTVSSITVQFTILPACKHHRSGSAAFLKSRAWTSRTSQAPHPPDDC